MRLPRPIKRWEITYAQRPNQGGYFMQSLVVLSILLVVLFSGDGHAGESSHASVGTKACHLKSIPIEHQVNYLTIHPGARVVAYTFIGEIGAPGGFKAIDYASGAEVDALPARSQHYVHMKISPSGKRLAFVQTEKGESSLKIGALDGSDAKVCTTSSSYYRPLAFSFDEQLLLALSSQGNDHQIILCNAAGSMLRSWATTTVLEHMKELLTLRFHGRPSWMVDTASISTDGKQILSVRTDGQIVLWDINGTRLNETTLNYFSLGSSDRRVAFAEDGTVLTFSHTTTDRQGRTPLIVSTLFPELKRFEVLREARVRAAPGTDHVYLYATRRGLYLVYLKPSGVAIVHARSGEVVAEVPVTAAVSALSMSQDGTVLGIAQHSSLELWRLAQEGDGCD
jgi:WD40 repeat protein